LTHDHPPEFRLLSGRSFEDVAELGVKAESAVRKISFRRERVSFRRGQCTVELPVVHVRVNVPLVGVPDAASWDRVMPECAAGRRDDFLGPIREYFESRQGEFEWEERSIQSLEELEAWVYARRRPATPAPQRSLP
jgi:hypothetical protein